MLLGLAYHATSSWLPGIAPFYVVADSSPVEALVTLSGVLHAFRMQLFFALSGFFSHLVFERRGAASFLGDRSRRLLVPFFFALPLTLLSDVFLRRWSASLGLMSPEYERGTDIHFYSLHLWFLVYLFCYCVVAWAMSRWATGAQWFIRRVRQPIRLLLLFAVPTCVGLVLHPENRPDNALYPLPYEFFHFGFFFVFGWQLWAARDSSDELKRGSPYFLASGVLLGLIVFHSPLQWQWSGQLLSGLVGWLFTVGCFGLALGSRIRQRPWLRFLVDSSYWVYLIHYPVLLALQVVFALQTWPGWLEYVLTIGLTLAFAFVTFALFVWRTQLGPWLGVQQRSLLERQISSGASDVAS